MAKGFELPERFVRAGWKAKIRDRETTEPPHVTILFKTLAWRINLRTRAFMDRRPPAREVPREVVDAVLENLGAIIEVWNELYPHNPV